MNNKVILVDLDNNKVGNEDKIEAHKKSLLHRAFSIFIFNQNKEILLQKRAKNKYHSALLWTNTCCSHPHDGLSTIKCAEIRLKQEMGIETKIKEIFSFIYKESFANGLTEYEYDHVFFGKYNSEPTLNIDEASDFRWINFKQLLLEIGKNPAKFTFWLKKIVQDYSLYFLDYENNNL